MKIVLTSICLLVIIFSALSQVKYLSSEIISALSFEDKKEIENAESIKSFGDGLMKEAELIEKGHGISMLKIDDYQAERIRQMDSKTIDVIRRSARKKIQASNYYGNANLIVTSIYTRNLQQLVSQDVVYDKEEINLLIEKNASLMKTSSLIRREALQMHNELLVYPYLMDANNIELEAIKKLQNAFSLIYKDAIVDDWNDLKTNNETSGIKNITSPANFYYKIQIAASKVAISAEKLDAICQTNEIISSEFANGWYKYSIRKKFKTYEKAFEYKEVMNVEGAFILAFVEGEKVPVSEAIILQNANTNTGIRKNDDQTVYRLQIGISTVPASEESMKMMRSGGGSVTMVDHDGWYTYTVGDFNSKRAAKKFKKNNGLTDATVVAYKNGKPIENN